MGTTDLVLCIDEKDKAEFDVVAERFKLIVEVVNSYKVEGKNNNYIITQLTAMYDNRSPEELCHFICSYFPFVALRQKGSSFILVSNAKDFRKLLGEVYPKERKLYFLYDMLSIEDRYDAACCIGGLSSFSENRLLHNEGVNVYSLILDSGCKYLFTDEPGITIMNEDTGIVEELDIIDGLSLFTFHVAILK